MQTAGMLRGTGSMRRFHVLVIGTLILAYIGEYAHALPLQVLPNIPGYIPVYIRHGDQPLDEINPALAEAFHEKQILENNPSERFDHSSDDLRKNLENQASYDDDVNDNDEELKAGTRRKGTIYLIGVKQSNDDDGTKKNEDLESKIALPFEILEREAIEGNAASIEDPEKSKDVWIELSKQGNAKRPIGLSKEAVIKAHGLPVDVKDLEKLAAEVEKEETRPNDLYDAAITDHHHHHHHHHVSSSRLSPAKLSIDDENTREKKNVGRNGNEADNRRTKSIEDSKEFYSSRSSVSEEIMRPAKDPKESRPDDESLDFMVQEE